MGIPSNEEIKTVFNYAAIIANVRVRNHQQAPIINHTITRYQYVLSTQLLSPS